MSKLYVNEIHPIEGNTISITSASISYVSLNTTSTINSALTASYIEGANVNGTVNSAVTASYVSASTGTLIVPQGQFGTNTTIIDDDIYTTGNITASGDISASGNVYTNELYINSTDTATITSIPPGDFDGEINFGGFVTSIYSNTSPTHNTTITGKSATIYPSSSIILQSHVNLNSGLFVNASDFHYPTHEGSGIGDQTIKNRLVGEWYSDGLTIREGGNTSEGDGQLVISGSTKNTLINNGNITTEGTVTVTGSSGVTTINNGNITTKGDVKITGSLVTSVGLSMDNLLGDDENDYTTGVSYFPKNREIDAMFFLGNNASTLATGLNTELYTYPTLIMNPPVLFWDRKINNYFIKNNLAAGPEEAPYFMDNFCVMLPPIINAGYASGEKVQIFNMTSGSAEDGGVYNYNLVHSGSIWINCLTNEISTVNTSSKTITATGNLNQGIYSGSWNDYKNVIYNGSNLDGVNYSIVVPPGHKAVFEVFHYGTPSSYIDITHPHPNNIAYQYGYSYTGYSSNYISGLSTEQPKVYRFISVDPL